jgi:hypothetical protein
MDGTRGKRKVWESNPIAQNLEGKFLLAPNGRIAVVCGHLSGVGPLKFKVSWLGGDTRYLEVEELIGLRVLATRDELDAALMAIDAARTKLEPEAYVEAAA